MKAWMPLQRSSVLLRLSGTLCFFYTALTICQLDIFGGSGSSGLSYHDYQNSFGPASNRQPSPSSVTTINDDDACRQNVSWISYGEEDYEHLNRVHECQQRFVQHQKTKTDQPSDNFRSKLNLTKLSWPAGCFEGERSVQELLIPYNRIHFIGDSVLRQQFVVLACSHNTSIEPDDFVPYQRHRNPHFAMNITLSRHPSSSNDNSLVLIYTPVGLRFKQPRSSPLETLYPESLQAHDTAIVLNSGLHYTAADVKELQRDVFKLLMLNQTTKNVSPHFYWIQATPQEWPTSNGIYVDGVVPHFCANQDKGCQCRRMTKDILQGRGRLMSNYDYSRAHIMVKEEDFASIYPAATLTTIMNATPANCVPNCLPASWRNDVIRPLLVGTGRNIKIVPIFDMLVQRNMLNHVNDYDCTHLGTDTLIEINRMLLRTFSKGR